jgi:hypothetical protein
MQHHPAPGLRQAQASHEPRNPGANHMAGSVLIHARLALACGMGMIPMA